jgi:hypothetical protein
MEFISTIVYSYSHLRNTNELRRVEATYTRTHEGGVRGRAALWWGRTRVANLAPVAVGRVRERVRPAGQRERGLDLCWGPYGGEHGGDVEDRTRFGGRSTHTRAPTPRPAPTCRRGTGYCSQRSSERRPGSLATAPAAASRTKDAFVLRFVSHHKVRDEKYVLPLFHKTCQNYIF